MPEFLKCNEYHIFVLHKTRISINCHFLAKISLCKKRWSNSINKKTSCEQVKKRGFPVNVKGGAVSFIKQALQHWGDLYYFAALYCITSQTWS
jgi:hypothetical protein